MVMGSETERWQQHSVRHAGCLGVGRSSAGLPALNWRSIGGSDGFDLGLNAMMVDGVAVGRKLRRAFQAPILRPVDDTFQSTPIQSVLNAQSRYLPNSYDLIHN
jgi:hypothetical protein